MEFHALCPWVELALSNSSDFEKSLPRCGRVSMVGAEKHEFSETMDLLESVLDADGLEAMD
jgi:hypothetical protein